MRMSMTHEQRLTKLEERCKEVDSNGEKIEGYEFDDIYYCGNVAEVYMDSSSAGTNNPVYFTNISTDPLN